MNNFNESLFKALAQTTRFNFSDENSSTAVSAAWLVAVRALLGVAYAVIAQLILWLVKVHAVGLILSTIVLFALHAWITAGREMQLPATIRKRVFPNLNRDENPSVDLLCNIIPVALTFLLLLCHGTMWIPAIMAIGTAAAAEISGQQPMQNFSIRQPKAWLVAALFVLVFLLLPCLSVREIFQAVFLRSIFLFAMAMLLLPWFRQMKTRSVNFTLNCVFMCLLITAATIIIISL